MNEIKTKSKHDQQPKPSVNKKWFADCKPMFSTNVWASIVRITATKAMNRTALKVYRISSMVK